MDYLDILQSQIKVLASVETTDPIDICDISKEIRSCIDLHYTLAEELAGKKRKIGFRKTEE